MDLPYLPETFFAKLQAQCLDEEKRKPALVTCWSIIEKFPALRIEGMRLLYRMAFAFPGETEAVQVT